MRDHIFVPFLGEFILMYFIGFVQQGTDRLDGSFPCTVVEREDIMKRASPVEHDCNNRTMIPRENYWFFFFFPFLSYIGM